MSLTLTVQNVDTLDNGGPTQLKLDRHGAVIGRSPHADWSLPDPKNYVSSTHCEIDYRDGQYVLIDKSTNGTMLNGAAERISGPQKLKDGDILSIGQYRVLVRTAGGAASGPSGGGANAPAAKPGGDPWGGWAAPGAGAPAAPQPAAASPAWDTPTAPAAASGGWPSASAPAPQPPISAPVPAPAPPATSSGWADPPAVAPVSTGWANPAPAAAPAPAGWANPPAAAPTSAGWGAPTSAPVSTPAPPPAQVPASASGWNDPSPAGPTLPGPSAARSGWDSFGPNPEAVAAGNAWESESASAVSGRGPMSQIWTAPRTDGPAGPAWAEPVSAETEDVWGQFAASNSVDWARGGFADAPAATPTATPAVSAAPPLPNLGGPAADEALWTAFAAACGLAAGSVKTPPAEAAAKAGGLLRRLVSGLVVMMEARARAKAQLGAQSTTLELGGNNPLKFARSPEQALAQLLNPAERGFMEAERAIEDSFQDLQAHQMATLQAMQGALRSTVERFSPEAIRTRAETRGLLARILPSARNAALWDAYQREFEGVARGSDEAFLDVFAKAFKTAYEQATHDMKAKR